MSAACDQDPVEAVAPDSTDPAFGERVRVRRPERCADDLDALASEDIVEGAAELAVAVVDQEADRRRSFRERPCELARLLRPPGPIRVCRAASEMHTPSAKLDEEEHIQTSEPERLDGEEIARDHRLGMRPQELAPAEPSSGTGRRHPGLAEDLGDGARADAHTQTSELTDDPLIAPARVLTRKTHHQHADLVRNPWPPGSPPGIGPPPPHKLAMPAQQGLRTDEKRLPAGPAQKPAGRGKKDPICLLKTRTGDLATKNRQLVSKHHDLKLLELTRPRTQRRHRERPPKQQVHQRHNHEQTPSTRTDDKPTRRPRNEPTPTSPRATGWIYAPNLFRTQEAADRAPQRATAQAIAVAVLRPRTRPESGPSRGTPSIEANRHDATPVPFGRHMPN